MPAAEMHMFICVHFFTNANSSGQTSGQKIKNAYTIYTLNIHFLYSKSAHTIYTPETTFPAGSSPSSGPVTTLPPRKFAGSRQKQDKLPPTTTALPPHTHTHILRAAELSIQRSKAKPQRDHNNTAKRYTFTQPQAYTYFFAHFSRFLQNGRQGTYIRPQKKKKEKKGYKKV